VWSVADGKALSAGVPSPEPTLLTCSDDGLRLFIGTSNDTLRAWDTLTLRPLTPALTYDEGFSAAASKPNGAYVAISFRSFVQVWDLATGKLLFPALLHRRPVRHVEFSRDGRFLVACSVDGQLNSCSARVWNAMTGQPVGEELRHKDGVLDATFSPDNRKVATAGEDFCAIIWDTRTGRQLSPPLLHNHQVHSVAFAPSGRWMLTASSDATARIWNARTDEPLTPPLLHIYSLEAATFLPDERHIVTTDMLKQSSLWELQVDGRPVDDLLALAKLMSADTADLAAQSSTDPIATSWETLSSRYPADFSVTEAEIIAWHSAQARQSEKARHWSSAVFHLQALQQLTPDDRAIGDRLDRATERLKTAD
jgi:WD40 repeat protein